MKPSMSFLVLFAISLVLILIVVAYYLFSKIAASTSSPNAGGSSDGADSLRKHGVTDLASKISYLAGDGSVVWPTDLTQIGSDTVGCQLTTTQCQVTLAECFNLQAHVGSQLRLPLDPVEGSEGKTGYAIKKTGNSLEIVACFAESSAPITQQLRF